MTWCMHALGKAPYTAEPQDPQSVYIMNSGVTGVLMSKHAGSHQRSCDERSEEAARLRAAGKRGRQRMHTLCRGLLACALLLA